MRVLVADDELLARRRIVRLLSGIDGVEVAGECETGEAVLERVKTGDIDVVLLDIRMPGIGGIEAAKRLPKDGPIVVLCTAHSDHAVEAFEHGATDYVMKPVEASRLKKALARAKEKLSSRPEAASVARGAFDGHPDHASRSAPEPAAPSGRPIDRLPISTRQGIVLLDPRTVSHAILDGELVTIVAESGTYLADEPLGELQERLPADLFERVHRRALLNLEHVTRLEPVETGGFVAHTRSGHVVEISRQFARTLRKRLRLPPRRI